MCGCGENSAKKHHDHPQFVLSKQLLQALANFYNRDEINTTLDHYFTKDEINALLAAIDLDEYYTKAEIDTNHYTKTASDNRYYTKAQIDASLATMQAQLDALGTTLEGLVLSHQTAFSAFKSTPTANVTGDGTYYDPICDWEINDVGSDYNHLTGVYTCPISGIYQFNWGVYVRNISAAHTVVIDRLVTPNFTIGRNRRKSTDGDFSFTSNSVTIPLSTNNTVRPRIGVFGGTKTVEVHGEPPPFIYTYFSGYLVRSFTF